MLSLYAMFEIRREGQASASVAEELGARLRKYNEERAGPVNWTPLVLSIRDDSNHIVAGLSAAFFWNALFIDVLWVDEAHRRHGHGSSLLRYAERDACERGCDIVYLSTFEFQALAYYAAQGYVLIGQLEGIPRKSKRLWFSKHVATTSV
ncbi:MAG TPA: GNAT family N-acetyltransferase [Burkholderiales bacterium]|nr:GNAT family N-acetyltransferase [Burkholderiales bacterium]